MNSLVLHGNAYLLVTSWAGARPVNVEPLHWNHVSWRGDVPYIGGKEVGLYPAGDLIVIPASPFLLPGSMLAQSPTELAKQSIGTGLAAEEFGARFFNDGAFPSSIIYSEQPLDNDGARAIKDSILNAVRGTREPAVLGAGLKYEQVSVNPSDSQFIDLMRFEIEQACRFFGVPPSFVYAAVSGQAVTYQNLASSDTQFFKHSLKSWMDDLEEAWSELLPAPQLVRLNVDSFLRMAAPDRHADQAVRLASHTATVNEIRAERNTCRLELAAANERIDTGDAERTELRREIADLRSQVATLRAYQQGP